MNFYAMINMPGELVPVRAYVHNTGRDVWNMVGDGDEIKDIRFQLQGMLQCARHKIPKFDYILAIMWGDLDPKATTCAGGYRMIDCFGYSGVPKDPAEWPGNPDVENWMEKEGLLVRKNKITLGGTTCEDSVIVLGEEGKHRRRCSNIREYVITPPHIKGLGRIIKSLS